MPNALGHGSWRVSSGSFDGDGCARSRVQLPVALCVIPCWRSSASISFGVMLSCTGRGASSPNFLFADDSTRGAGGLSADAAYQ